jgi:hypothetical protein
MEASGWLVHGGWQALAAVRSPARPPGTIGVERPCARIVTEWRTSSTKAIRPNATREERTELTGVKGNAAALAQSGSGRSGGGGRGWCGEGGARAVPFIGAREGGKGGGTATPTS